MELSLITIHDQSGQHGATFHATDHLKNANEDWQRFLSNAEASLPWTIHCCCHPRPEQWIPMVVYRRSVNHRDLFYLRRHPNTGAEHAKNCPLFKSDVPEGGLTLAPNTLSVEFQDDPESAIQHRVRHTVHRCAFSLSRRRKGSTDSGGCAITTGHSAHAQPARSITLVGLLNLIVSNARLNRWFYDKEKAIKKDTPLSMLTRVQQSLEHRPIRLGRRKLDNFLLYPTCNPTELLHQTRQKLINTPTAKQINSHLVFFQLVAPKNGSVFDDSTVWVAVTKAIPRDNFQWFGEKPFYWLGKAGETVFSRYAEGVRQTLYNRLSEYQDPVNSDIKILALARAESTRNDSGIFNKITDIATIATNRHYIPIESEYEARFADHLIEAGHSFVKPLTLEPATGAFELQTGLRSDFILPASSGREKDLKVEIYGMNTPQYRQHQAEKQMLYQDAQARGEFDYLEWCANDNAPMPIEF